MRKGSYRQLGHPVGMGSFVHVLIKVATPEVFACLVDYDAAEADERDEVWDCHESVHAVGYIPHKSEADDASYKDRGYVEHAVSEHPSPAFQVFHAALAIVAPTEDGGEGERQQPER